MRTAIGSIIGALVLAAAGAVCWILGGAERALASAEQQLAMMRFGVAADPSALQPALGYTAPLPILGSRLATDAHNNQATAEYWLGRYETLTAPRDSSGAAVARDPEQLLVASNASYRATQGETVERQTAINHLEAVIKGYAEALKANPGHEDAAYNYEFVVRVRDSLARPKATATPSKPLVADAAPTIHGKPGAPPKGVSMSNFKVIVPKQSDERSGGEEAGKGGVKVRKG